MGKLVSTGMAKSVVEVDEDDRDDDNASNREATIPTTTSGLAFTQNPKLTKANSDGLKRNSKITFESANCLGVIDHYVIFWPLNKKPCKAI